jgi:hypothetical protein
MPRKPKERKVRKVSLKLRAVTRVEPKGEKPIVRMVIDAEDAPPVPVEEIPEPVELLHPDEPVTEPIPEKAKVLTWWQSLWEIGT